MIEVPVIIVKDESEKDSIEDRVRKDGYQGDIRILTPEELKKEENLDVTVGNEPIQINLELMKLNELERYDYKSGQERRRMRRKENRRNKRYK